MLLLIIIVAAILIAQLFSKPARIPSEADQSMKAIGTRLLVFISIPFIIVIFLKLAGIT
jgi:hypothetical protein